MSAISTSETQAARQFAPWTGTIPRGWDAVEWPEWVPAKVRDEIASFWAYSSGRGPREYEQSTASPYNNAPDFGERVTLKESGSARFVSGRYVHAWNNMGRVVGEDGTVFVVSTGAYRRDLEQRRAYFAEAIAHAETHVEHARAALRAAEASLAYVRDVAAAIEQE